MAKNVAKTATPPTAPKAAKPAKPTPPARKRPAAYQESSKIVISTGDDARRVVKNLTCDRALTVKKAHDTVGKYRDAFAKQIEAMNKAKPGSGDLPGRGGQPAATQAVAILRFLEKEGAVTVR